MATTHTPENFAREILDIFVNHFGRPPGGVLRLQNFSLLWFERGHDSDDFRTGLEHAVDAGWLEVLSSNSFRPTQDGHEQADASPDE
jgi:hypothetical protein